MTDIIEMNSLSLHRAVGRISRDKFEKTAKRVGTKETPLVLPDISEALPKRSVFSRKAAEKGKVLTDNMRDRVTKSLRQTFAEFTPKSGEPAFVLQTGKRKGRVNPKLVQQFERAIVEDFAGYTKVDPSYGIPANIHAIAVTEVRSVADEMKWEYAKRLALKNYEDFEMRKKWIHNKSLSESPRPHHMAANGMTVGFYDWFVLSNGARLRFPHDPEASPEETISCHCDYDILIRRLT